MRHRIILAALLAGSAFTPALAQEVEATVEAPAETPTVVAPQAAVAAQPVVMAVAEQEDRGMRGMREGREDLERGPRRDGPQRQQALPPVMAPPEVQAQPRPDWQDRQARGNDGENRGGWQRPEAPVVMAAPQAPVVENREWRGNGGNPGGGWQRREAPVMNAPAIPPVQNRIEANRDWRGGNEGGWNRGEDRRPPPPQGGWNQGGDRRPPPPPSSNWNRPGGNPGWQNRDADRRWDNDRRGDNDRRWDNNQRWGNDRWGDRNWDNRGWNGNQNWGWNNNQRWNRDWRSDRRYDWQRYRYSNRDLYRMPRYYAPYGYSYGYERFGIGIYLESLFYGSRYRISDPWRYRLPDAQWPYEWVRYYDDVLLVDTRSGYVVDVIYDFFW